MASLRYAPHDAGHGSLHGGGPALLYSRVCCQLRLLLSERRWCDLTVDAREGARHWFHVGEGDRCRSQHVEDALHIRHAWGLVLGPSPVDVLLPLVDLGLLSEAGGTFERRRLCRLFIKYLIRLRRAVV